MDLTSTGGEASGVLAFDSGTYVQRFALRGGGSFETHGSYVMIMRHIGPRWLIVRHMWTEDAVATPAPQRPAESPHPSELRPTETQRPLDVRSR